MDITHHNPSAINPFSLGPRRCLGKDLAWLEMQLAMARLLWNFDIFMDDVVPPVQWGYLKTYGVVERQPVMVRVKRRQAD
jgi:cytochrome P450